MFYIVLQVFYRFLRLRILRCRNPGYFMKDSMEGLSKHMCLKLDQQCCKSQKLLCSPTSKSCKEGMVLANLWSINQSCMVSRPRSISLYQCVSYFSAWQIHSEDLWWCCHCAWRSCGAEWSDMIPFIAWNRVVEQLASIHIHYSHQNPPEEYKCGCQSTRVRLKT